MRERGHLAQLLGASLMLPLCYFAIADASVMGRRWSDADTLLGTDVVSVVAGSSPPCSLALLLS